jgi:pilus assembly protein Flp/PilA
MSTLAAIKRFAADTRGTTAIEYSIIATGIACAIVTTVTLLGSSVVGLWTKIANQLAP